MPEASIFSTVRCQPARSCLSETDLSNSWQVEHSFCVSALPGPSGKGRVWLAEVGSQFRLANKATASKAPSDINLVFLGTATFIINLILLTEHFENMFGEMLLDLIVTWNRLRHSRVRVLIPVMPGTMSNEYASQPFQFAYQIPALHATSNSATRRTQGMASLANS